MKFKVAAVQMNSREDVGANLKSALHLIREAAAQGAQVVALPETFLYIGPDKTKVFKKDGDELNQVRAMAREKKVVVVAGSIREKVADLPLPVNVCYVVSEGGAFLAEYRKIHLFDVDLPTGEIHRESEETAAGRTVQTVPTPFGVWGLSICYDLRFPELYRRQALQGADIFFVPSNFTRTTGKAHWHILVRARAIENTCYLVAPAQIGKKYKDRESHGKSLIVDPWGKVVAEAPDQDEVVIYGDIDLDLVQRVRRALPTLNHVKLIEA